MHIQADPDNDDQLVSVIIPAFNAATTIKQTIQSVLAQTHPNFEILVIDDGSVDETCDIVKKLSEDDGRIRLLKQENRGVAAARNEAIKHARGKYIAPLDADDLWLPQKLEKQVAIMNTEPISATVGLVYTWSTQIIDSQCPGSLSRGWEQEGSVFLPLLLANYLSNASTPLISRECFDRVGMYDMDYLKQDAQGCEDWDIYLRIAEHYEFRVVPEHLTAYRQSSQSMSADWHRMDQSYKLLMERVQHNHPQIPAYVFRWSKSNYLLYLAIKATQAKLTTDSLLLLSKAVALDPYMLLNSRFQRIYAKNLLRKVRKQSVHKQSQQSQSGQVQSSQITIGRVNKKPAMGTFWSHLVKRRTHQLLELQKALKLDVTVDHANNK